MFAEPEGVNRSGTIVSTEEKRLTLAYEDLSEIPEHLVADYANIIEVLELSHNQISNVDFLARFSSISTLILDHNKITEDINFPRVNSLTMLWLNHNEIKKLHPFLLNLRTSFPNLKYLSLMGNLACPSYLNGGTYYQYLQYRLFVISWFQDLEYLDDRQVTDDQRQEATRLYGKKLLRTLKQSLGLNQYNPATVFKRFQSLFKFLPFGRKHEVDAPNFGDGEQHVRVEEFGGIIRSDSDSSSLNNLIMENENIASDPNPYKEMRIRSSKNLVI